MSQEYETKESDMKHVSHHTPSTTSSMFNENQTTHSSEELEESQEIRNLDDFMKCYVRIERCKVRS